MRYKLDANTVRIALVDFLKSETDLLWIKDMDVHVGVYTDDATGGDTFRVNVLGLIGPPDFGEDWRDTIHINEITIDLYRPAPHVQDQIHEFAHTTRNLLRLML